MRSWSDMEGKGFWPNGLSSILAETGLCEDGYGSPRSDLAEQRALKSLSLVKERWSVRVPRLTAACVQPCSWFSHRPELITVHTCFSGVVALPFSRNLCPRLFSISWLLILGLLDCPSAPRNRLEAWVPCSPPPVAPVARSVGCQTTAP